MVIKYSLATLFSCLVFLVWKEATASQQINDQALSDILMNNRYALSIEGGDLTGNGSEVILGEGRQADIFMFGENHGVREIAELTQIFYAILSEQEARILVTEIGPATAAEAEHLIRQGSYEAFLKEGTNLMSVPFFFLEQEVPLLYQVTSKFPDAETSIWGLDQEFIAGIPIISKRLSRLVTTEQEKEALGSLNRANFFNPFLIGFGDGQTFKELRTAFGGSSPEAQRIADQLIRSHEIYQANSDGRGRWSNETRETLMMENFEHYVSSHEGDLPPLFFRFGAYHLHKGSSPTVREALGLRVDTWAKDRQKTTLNVLVDAIDGETLDPLLGTKAELPSKQMWAEAIFKDFLLDSQATLFDLRPLKGHPETKEMSNRIRHMLKGYDYLILFRTGNAQNYMPGTLVTYGYGIPVLVFVLIILSLMIWGGVRLVKRWRKRGNSTA